jgi:hypothetical protein
MAKSKSTRRPKAPANLPPNNQLVDAGQGPHQTIELGEEPAGGFTVPGYSDLYAVWEWNSDPGVTCIHYSGWPEGLIALGVATRELLTPTGRPRCDATGYPFRFTRRWKERGASVQRYYKVQRFVSTAHLERLPWARDAVEAHERKEAWTQAYIARISIELREEEERRRQIAQSAARPQLQHGRAPYRSRGRAKPIVASHLRLVVDNTRSE